MKAILVGILVNVKGEVGCPWDYHRTIEGNQCCINVLGCWVSQTGKLTNKRNIKKETFRL